MQPNNNNSELYIPLADMPAGGILELRENEQREGRKIIFAERKGTSWHVVIMSHQPAIIEGEFSHVA